MDSSDADCHFLWFVHRNTSLSKDAGNYDGYILKIRIEQTEEWITGLYLKLICQFVKGFRRSLDVQRVTVGKGMHKRGMAWKNSERVNRPGEIAPDRLKEKSNMKAT